MLSGRFVFKEIEITFWYGVTLVSSVVSPLGIIIRKESYKINGYKNNSDWVFRKTIPWLDGRMRLLSFVRTKIVLEPSGE